MFHRCVMRDGAVFYLLETRAAPFAFALATFLLGGCDEKAAPPPPAPAPAKAEAPAGTEPALQTVTPPEKKTPAPKGAAIEEMLARLQPAPDPQREARSKDEEAKLLAEAGGLIAALVKEIDADDAAALQARLIPKEELEAMVSEGMRRILVGNLLPENGRVVQRLVESCRGKDVALKGWTPGKLQSTRPGPTFRIDAPYLTNSVAEVSSAGESIPLIVDLIHRGGRWVVFRIARKG